MVCIECHLTPSEVIYGNHRSFFQSGTVPDWVVMNGNRVQVKRKAFERFIDATDVI